VSFDVPYARARWRAAPPLAAAGAVAVGLALLGRWTTELGLGVALASVALAGAIELLGDARYRSVAPVPMIAGFVVLAAGLPLGPGPDLLAAAGGVVLLAWVAEDPARPAGGVLRGAIGWALPGLAVGLAWASSFLLPPSSAPIGIAGGLLAAVVIALAALFHRPEIVTSEQAPVSPSTRGRSGTR
jgi:hypothetical protein